MQASPRLLTHSNLQRLLDEVGALYKPVRPQQLAGHFAGVLRRLIPGGVSWCQRRGPSKARPGSRTP